MAKAQAAKKLSVKPAAALENKRKAARKWRHNRGG